MLKCRRLTANAIQVDLGKASVFMMTLYRVES